MLCVAAFLDVSLLMILSIADQYLVRHRLCLASKTLQHKNLVQHDHDVKPSALFRSGLSGARSLSSKYGPQEFHGRYRVHVHYIQYDVLFRLYREDQINNANDSIGTSLLKLFCGYFLGKL